MQSAKNLIFGHHIQVCCISDILFIDFDASRSMVLPGSSPNPCLFNIPVALKDRVATFNLK